MIRKRVASTLFAMTFLMSACGTLPDTTLGHTCGIPDGVGCLSTQEVYDRTIAGDLPGLRTIDGAPSRTRHPEQDFELPAADDSGPRMIRTRALYAPPEELRIWVNQWRDTDGDLHDDSFIYVLLGEGQWLVRD